jgi:PST family polysaccharide transporter/stage V sporulation protein B
MSDYVGILPTLIGLLLLPKLSQIEDMGEKYSRMKKATIGTIMMQGPIVLLSAVLAPGAVYLLFGKAYALSVPAFLWLCPGVLFLSVHTVAVQFLNSVGYPMSVVWIWFGCVLLKIALNLWWIPLWGVQGAASSSSVCYILATLLVLAAIRREMRVARAIA